MKYIRFIKLIIIVLFFSACESNKLDIDVSHVDLEVKVHRFDRELFETNPDSIFRGRLKFEEEYGDFFQRYIENVIGIGQIDDPGIADSLRKFINDPYITELYNDVKKAYPDLSWLNEGLTDAFKHYKFYFPEKIIPKPVAFISGLNYAMVTTDSVLGIGLTMYLGRHYKNYAMMGFPEYKTANMNAANILPDAVKGWVSTEIDFEPSGKDLLAQIVHQGKMMYILDAILPKVEDSLKIGYTSQQMEWCKNNEANIWAHFIDKELLFSTDFKEVVKYMNEGPFTPGFPRESPSKTGTWMGWQIVRAYMDRQENIDLNKLIGTDARVILKESKYKPKK